MKAAKEMGEGPRIGISAYGGWPGTSSPTMDESGRAWRPRRAAKASLAKDESGRAWRPRRAAKASLAKDESGRAWRPRRAATVSRRRAAFTLIEVLLALALFAIAVVVLAASYINVLFGLQAVRADRVLEQEMAFVRSVILTAPDLETIEDGGELPTGALGYAYWEAELEPTQIADLFVVQVTVVLEGTGDDEERSLNERLIVLRPAWSEPLDREELRAESMKRLEDIRRNRPL